MLPGGLVDRGNQSGQRVLPGKIVKKVQQGTGDTQKGETRCQKNPGFFIHKIPFGPDCGRSARQSSAFSANSVLTRSS